MMDDPTFTSQGRRDKFMEELTDLLNEYPEFVNAMRKEYVKDPTHERWQDVDQDFDPTSPTFVDGWVLVFSTANMQGWRDITVLTPPRQNTFTSMGMLDVAHDQLG